MLDEKPEIKTVVMGMVDEWVKAARHTETAVSMTVGGDRAFSGHGLMRVDNPAAILALGRRIAGLFQQGPIHDAYKRMGVEMQIIGKPGVRKVHGWPVDRYEYKITVAPQISDPAVKRMWEKLAGMTYEVAQVGPYLVYGVNASVDEIVRALFAPSTAKSATGPARGLQATTAFPAGGSFYADVNVAALLRGFRSLLPEGAATRVPELPAESGTLMLFGYDGGDVSYYKARLPMTLLLSIKTVIDRTTSRMDLDGPRPLPGAPPN
jgi:hypothetical protein